MEPYIENNLSDITYRSELILAAIRCADFFEVRKDVSEDISYGASTLVLSKTADVPLVRQAT